jgi:fused signal recognition particle receptor
VAIAAEIGLAVRFVGVGEGVDDLRPFQAAEFAAALLRND